jgi:hypothetical protein
VVPQGVPPGCNVSLVVQTVSVAPNGGTCSDSHDHDATADVAAGEDQLQDRTIFDNQRVGYLPTATVTTLAASALFENITISGQIGVSTVPNLTVSTVSAGSCSVTEVTEPIPGSSGRGGGAGTSGVTVAGLNAGGSLSLAYPSGGALPLQAQSAVPGFYTGTPSSLPGGTYEFSNGSGGGDIGPFTISLGIPSPLVWTNADVAKSVIDRTEPLTLAWTGGDPNGSVIIDLSSLVSNTSTATENNRTLYGARKRGSIHGSTECVTQLDPDPSSGREHHHEQ